MCVLDRVNDRGKTAESIVATIICHGTDEAGARKNSAALHVYRKRLLTLSYMGQQFFARCASEKLLGTALN